MFKLIRLVFMAAVVLGATVLMALPKNSASEETARPITNSSNGGSAAGDQSPAAAPAGSPPVTPPAPVTTTGPMLPGPTTTTTTTARPAPRDVPGTTIIPPVPPREAPARTVWPTTHVIQSGDPFQKIAKQYYGGFSKWRRIADANPGVDPTRIRPGQKLKIPDPAR